MSALTIGSLSACGEMKPGTVTPGESPAGDSGHPDQPNMVTATRRSEGHKSFIKHSFFHHKFSRDSGQCCSVTEMRQVVALTFNKFHVHQCQAQIEI